MAGWKWQRSSRLLKHEATLRITSTKTVSSNILSKQLPVERGTVGVVFYPKTQQHNGLSQGSNPCPFFNARLTVSTLNPSWNENHSGFKVGLSASFWKMPFNAFCVTNFPPDHFSTISITMRNDKERLTVLTVALHLIQQLLAAIKTDKNSISIALQAFATS